MFRLVWCAGLMALIATESNGQNSCGWNPDSNGDFAITVADLLALLGVFEEVDLDQDGIWDSVDDCIGQYDECEVCNGNGTDLDSDGICDFIDPCVGTYDICGVCNGPGPTYPVFESVEWATDSVFVDAINDWVVISIPVDTIYSFVCEVIGCMDPIASNFNVAAVIPSQDCLYGPPECDSLSFVHFQGHRYDLVAIGDQCWFDENLRSTAYRNGDPIPGDLPIQSWSTTIEGARSFTGEDENPVWMPQGYITHAQSIEYFGLLYNFYAVDDERELCPTGFRVPSIDEWAALGAYLGGWDCAGPQLKATPNHVPSWDGTNSTGFTALPSRSRSEDGNIEWGQGFWSRTSYDGLGYFIGLGDGHSLVNINPISQRVGFSVRCLKEGGADACIDVDGNGVCDTNEVYGCTNPDALGYDSTATRSDDSCDNCHNLQSVNYQGVTYDLVSIGSQCWFTQNLSATTYSNGDTISSPAPSYQIELNLIGQDILIDSLNLSLGRFYNPVSVLDPRGLCPSGSHIATDADFGELEVHLGMSEIQRNSFGWRGINEGDELKASPESVSPWTGENSVGFDALSTGYLYPNGVYEPQGISAAFWTPDFASSTRWARYFHTIENRIYRHREVINGWASVRCILNQTSTPCFDPDADGVCGDDEVSGCTDESAINFLPEATEGDGSCNFCSQNTISYQGVDYPLISAGGRCWFGSNLRAASYSNGDSIPMGLASENWSTTTSGAASAYGDGSGPVYGNAGDPVAFANSFGYLYNWYATQDPRNVCPQGFRVATDSDWNDLENQLGGRPNAGYYLKSTHTDVPPWNGANSLGMSLTPGGNRTSYGFFDYAGSIGTYWTSTISEFYSDYSDFETRGIARDLFSESNYCARANFNATWGFSIRCVSDNN